MADTTAPDGYGVLTWGHLVPAPGGLDPLPDTDDRALMCWRKPSLDVLDNTLVCIIFLDESFTITEARSRGAVAPGPPPGDEPTPARCGSRGR